MKLNVKKASQKFESKWKQTNSYVYLVESMYAQGKLFHMTLHVLIWLYIPAAAAKSLQSCPTLCNPRDSSPPRLRRPWDSPGKNAGVGCHFLLQSMKVKSESEVAQSCRLFSTPWTAAHQAPPSMGFSRQAYWSGVPLPSLIHILVNHKFLIFYPF